MDLPAVHDVLNWTVMDVVQLLVWVTVSVAFIVSTRAQVRTTQKGLEIHEVRQREQRQEDQATQNTVNRDLTKALAELDTRNTAAHQEMIDQNTGRYTELLATQATILAKLP